ncbi:spore maturation protein CgeB [Butyrivibrio proteoclasticus]|uniref:Spore maturation protein CgeB n=1 Tax=Butyrivibrio proteoclasticus TaxID=43305 RepID=A0A1I5Y5R3_9FIRM|nr:DUF3880 domain-containing protein [Butyrivibrio proteoclasticus]SFQ39538.1 spore maturation protein CgeB [Butyrivibrio proteoclasticus]
MKIFFLDWKSIGNEDIVDAIDNLNKSGYSIDIFMHPFDNHIDDGDKEYETTLEDAIKKQDPDIVFSFNYFPLVSIVCNRIGITYVAWVYDNPCVRLYSYTLINSCNYVFVFDSQMYEVFASQGIKNVYYLPMAAAVHRYDGLKITPEKQKRYSSRISFVGSLYCEDHTYFDDIADKLSDYSKGYLDGLMKSQMQIDGLNIIEKSIPPVVMQDMVNALGIKPSSDSVATYEYLYSNYVINRKITSIERTEILTQIGEKFGIDLYTKDKSFSPKGVNNHGETDYYFGMPYVFKCSDINLNITLRSIQRGIPLRIMDILGCGGFLLTNYQEDLFNFFVPGEEFVYYESRDDLMKKIGYYLEHDDERREIAQKGYEKVCAEHTYEQRLMEILDIVTP